MKPFIGIIMRSSITKNGNKIDLVYKDIIKAVIKSGGIPISIPSDYFKEYLNICSGYIIQGGDDIEDSSLNILKYLNEKNIPTLGICLGMQEMAYLANGVIYDINNHKDSDMHEIIIDKNSLLYKILNCERTMVNSRHISAVKKTDLYISSKSSDYIVESIENKKNKFYIGIQWHPENMYEYDSNSRKIFDYFIKICSDK